MNNRAGFFTFSLPVLIILTSLSLLAGAQPKFEFRAVWIATVENIDWPSKKGLPVQQQKAEFIRILDMHQRNGMNAVIMQVRPAADAFFPSSYEPWSEYLTGRQGTAPSPYYDPLQFMIEETHKRGMEFHAWLNPYRAVFNVSRSSIAANHITRAHPDWFVTYGDKKYFNPGEPAVIAHVTDVVKDIVRRYDVDGIHMDDYFYPYRINGREFPDEAAYRKYGNGLTKDAWRRSNCDSIVKSIYLAIQATKPQVKFGISPFGVWRNSSQDPMGSETKAGQTNYDDLYADILLWLENGWIDYVAPQLYWEIGHRLCDYEVLLDWWSKHTYGRHLYIGHGVYRVYENPTKAWRSPIEIPDQIRFLRDYPEVQGSVYFSSKTFEYNPNGWCDSLRENYYRYPAIVPPMPWKDTVLPLKPAIVNATDGTGSFAGKVLKIDAGEIVADSTVKAYAVYCSNNFSTLGQQLWYVFACQGKKTLAFDIWASSIPPEWNNCYVAVSSISRNNNESPLSNVVEYIKTNRGWMLPRQ
ncbi:glycoside hydrolase family 10 protein [Foetidibacter luteolus]|uniref:glycoside hydrolase family 10 protein n=1 Tax=Foetidibacter luteolus TaxID=2608880 RepID=UPI00129AA3FF|nr:family 10 glycosylhydrolase [Foetidibacter luteolus]